MKMTKATERALRKSIAKWRKNAQAQTPDDAHIFGDTCALCQQIVTISGYRGSRAVQHNCEGCPVKRAGERCDDGDTVWHKARRALIKWRAVVDFNDDDDVADHRNAFSAAATRMADFLESLLPSSAAKPTE